MNDNLSLQNFGLGLSRCNSYLRYLKTLPTLLPLFWTFVQRKPKCTFQIKKIAKTFFASELTPPYSKKQLFWWCQSSLSLKKLPCKRVRFVFVTLHCSRPGWKFEDEERNVGTRCYALRISSQKCVEYWRQHIPFLELAQLDKEDDNTKDGGAQLQLPLEHLAMLKRN